METITVPSAHYMYLNMFEKCMVLGEDWDIYDFKTPSDASTKRKKPFQISKVKVLTYEKNKVSVQTTYSTLA